MYVLVPPRVSRARPADPQNMSQFGIISPAAGYGILAWEKERRHGRDDPTKPASRPRPPAKLIADLDTLGIARCSAAASPTAYVTSAYPHHFCLGRLRRMALLLWWMLVAFAAITCSAVPLTKSAIAAVESGPGGAAVLGIASSLPRDPETMPTRSRRSPRTGPGQDPGFIAADPLQHRLVAGPVRDHLAHVPPAGTVGPPSYDSLVGAPATACRSVRAAARARRPMIARLAP